MDTPPESWTLADVIGRLIWHILPALCGVALGGILVNRFFVRKANLAGLVDRACDRLDALKDFCAEYWTSDASDDAEKRTGQEILEAKIKAGVLYVNALYRVASAKYGQKSYLTKEMISELQDLCTGGAFETKKRKADKRQFMRIARAIDNLAAAFQQLKL